MTSQQQRRPPRRRPSARGVVVGLMKLALVAAVLWFVRRTIVGAVADLSQRSWRLEWGWLAASAGLYLASVAPAGLYWRRVLLALGQHARVGETLRAYYIGHLGKYVPGKAVVVVLRAGLVRSHRVEAAAAAVSVFYETGTMMSVGAVLAAIVLGVQFGPTSFVFLVAAGLALATTLPTLPPLFAIVVRTTGVARRWLKPAHWQGIGYATLAEGWLWMTAGWVLMAASWGAALRGLGAEGVDLPGDMPLLLASVAMAVVAGFLSFVPGGAIVREAILAQLIAPRFGEAAAVGGAVALRLVWLVAELGISVILYFVGPRPERPPPDALPPSPAA